MAELYYEVFLETKSEKPEITSYRKLDKKLTQPELENLLKKITTEKIIEEHLSEDFQQNNPNKAHAEFSLPDEDSLVNEANQASSCVIVCYSGNLAVEDLTQ